MATITLSKSQSRALGKFFDFIEDKETKIFILKGYAGTGKTTLVKEFIKVLQEKGVEFKMLASTGRAAKILTNLTKDYNNELSGDIAKTIHSQIYHFAGLNQDIEKVVKKRDDEKADSTGQLYLNFDMPPENFRDNSIYFIDESSMISDIEEKHIQQARYGTGRLLNDLLEYNKNGKFVFIGDACQLPPVNQKKSPALDADYFKKSYHLDSVECELTEIQRQDDGNDIKFAAEKLRNLYNNPQPWTWAKFPLRGYQNIHILKSQADLINRYINIAKESGFSEASLITYSNKGANLLSELIRPIFGHSGKTIEVGDLLLVTQNSLVTGLLNGDLITVKNLGTRRKKANLTFIETEVQELFTKRVYNQLLIEDVLYANETNLTSEQFKEMLIDYYYRMKENGITSKEERYYIEMKRDPYLNALRTTYGYALTCHKGQGGEWNHVFLDIPSYFAKGDKPYIYQWMYTAVTRAKRELYLVDGFWIDGFK